MDSVGKFFYPQVRKTASQSAARSGAVVGKKHPAPKNLRSKDAGIVCGPVVNGGALSAGRDPGKSSPQARANIRAARRRGPLEAGDAFRGDNAVNRAVKLGSG